MANAHLANSHPDVTPDWIEWDFPRVSYLDAAKTTRIDTHRYEGIIPPVWCANVATSQSSSALGGLCASILIGAARQFCRDNYARQTPWDPLLAFVEFLKPAPQGRYVVRLQERSAGARQKSIQAEIISPDDEAVVYSVAIVRMGTLEERQGAKSVQPEHRPLPDRVADCSRWVNSLWYWANPPAASLRVYAPNDGETLYWSPKFGGREARDQWCKLDDDTLLQIDHVPLVADIIPDLPLNFEEDTTLAASAYLMPSISFTFQFREKFSDAEWLMSRSTMKRLHNGRYDMDTQIIDDNGTIVASCLHTSALIPRNLGKKKDSNL